MIDLRTSVCIVFCSLAVTSVAAADVVPEGMAHAPLDVAIDGQAAFADTTFVLLGCSSEGERHQVSFAKADGPMRCPMKGEATVHAVPTKDVKPLQDLVAKDLGWAQEGIEARKLLEKAPSCGAIKEKTLVEKSKNVTSLSVRYALEKTASGCTIKKVGDTVTQTASSAAPTKPSATPSATPSVAPSASAAPASGTTPAKGGCDGCAASRTSGTDTALACLGLAIAGLVCAARRRRTAAR